MRKILFSLLLSVCSLISAQEIEGDWEGNLKTKNFQLPLIIHIQKKDKDYSVTFDSPKQGAKDIPFDTASYNNGTLLLEKTSLNISYSGKLIDNGIKGTFKQNGMTIPLNLTPLKGEYIVNRPQTPKAPYNFDEKEVFFKNKSEGNLLAGSLVTPKNVKNKDFPLVVMITGSGSQDRNESIMQHQPFLVIADYLAQNGIGSLRLDDRGIGKSEKGKEDATTADFSVDISSAVDYLTKEKFTNIGLLGHSEGGMIAPMTTMKNKNVKFQILLAGPGIPIKELMLLQMKNMMLGQGLTEQEADENNTLNKTIYDFTSEYKGDDFSSDFKTFIHKNLKDKMPEDNINQFADRQVKTLSNPWFMYFIKFNPDEYLSKIKIPTLALNGSLDMQVTSKENLNGIKKSLEKAHNKNFKIIELAGLNHLFQTAKTGYPIEYSEIEETFSPKALALITDWIKGL